VGEPILALKNVSFSAQRESIIRDISFQYMEGKTTALIGPSGGGKSTALKLSAGLLLPTQGEARFRGRNIAAMTRSQNRDFRQEGAVVFQDSALWANQDIYQNLELPLLARFPKMGARERDERIKAAAAQVGYRRSLAIRPANLSMGEQKLIGFARALLCRPTLLFLDEWTESLDDEAAGRLVGIVRQFQAQGGTLIFVSHDLKLIEYLADFVVMIKGGRVSAVLAGSDVAEKKLLDRMNQPLQEKEPE
jgi:ABC-type multidrug transport system ATPase subunit